MDGVHEIPRAAETLSVGTRASVPRGSVVGRDGEDCGILETWLISFGLCIPTAWARSELVLAGSTKHGLRCTLSVFVSPHLEIIDS